MPRNDGGSYSFLRAFSLDDLAKEWGVDHYALLRGAVTDFVFRTSKEWAEKWRVSEAFAWTVLHEGANDWSRQDRPTFDSKKGQHGRGAWGVPRERLREFAAKARAREARTALLSLSEGGST